jgi:hypothetical protein
MVPWPAGSAITSRFDPTASLATKCEEFSWSSYFQELALTFVGVPIIPMPGLRLGSRNSASSAWFLSPTRSNHITLTYGIGVPKVTQGRVQQCKSHTHNADIEEKQLISSAALMSNSYEVWNQKKPTGGRGEADCTVQHGDMAGSECHHELFWSYPCCSNIWRV